MATITYLMTVFDYVFFHIGGLVLFRGQGFTITLGGVILAYMLIMIALSIIAGLVRHNGNS